MAKIPAMPAILTLLLLFLFALPLAAQEDDDTSDETSSSSDEEGLKRFWQLSLPDGNFMVALARIASISRSSYILDGGLIVTEVTIDTDGNSLCRIYQITPATDNSKSSSLQRASQRARELATRAEDISGSNFSKMVQKNYPTTTHAKTVEYRVEDSATLDALYNSLNKAWSENKGRRFTIAQ